MRGRVYLVGAGPGDPELITVRGLRVLRGAEVVVYDRLVHPRLVAEAPREAERIFVGGQGAMDRLSQEEINRLLVERARAGKRVVRLKGGDPFVFGRGGEEVEALRAAGVPYEVVPGVTAAVAVPGAAEIPVTHRAYSSGFAVVTGHECGGPSDLDWGALVRVPTVVVLMGLRRLSQVVDRLVAHGADLDVPAAVISRGTLPEQRVVVGRLEEIVQKAAEATLPSPATLVVGRVVRLSPLWTEPARDAAPIPAGLRESGR
ncbi:MAG: uroporphyrinogen-III C-methyltransferase [Armatimonadota bacterium]|nr:uroporphyrinogen-III C-methyltransferase [Armatimonadota bacterium]MDR7562704.1 uroporphyrinogen-III C-methyltransferase [Armatimonadota bacterium]MDR7602221.1 uroporphyrinogen-III C-methyltransferase [Armatimonadota bacterium]